MDGIGFFAQMRGHGLSERTKGSPAASVLSHRYPSPV